MVNSWFWTNEEEWSSILSMKGCSTTTSDMVVVVEEERLRYRATGYINQVAHHLGINSILAAQTMLHRFYCRNKFEEYPYEEVACVCLFITMKVEHSKAIPIKHLIGVAGTAAAAASTTRSSTKPLTEKRIISLELYVLAQLCFDITPPAPLPLLLDHIKSISPAGEDVLMKAMTHCKDAHRTTLPVRVSMSDLAKASIRYAMRSSDNSRNGGVSNGDSAGFDKTYELVERILDHLYSPESVKTIRRK